MLAPTALTFDDITRLAATNYGPHRPAEHLANASAAVLHLAVDAHDRALAIRNGLPIEQLDELPHEASAEHRSCFEERSEIIGEAFGERVDDHRHADGRHNPSRRCNPNLGKDRLACRDDFADLDYRILLLTHSD